MAFAVPLSAQLYSHSPRQHTGPAGGGGGSGVNRNANNVFQASLRHQSTPTLRKGSGNGGNPTPYARGGSKTPRDTSKQGEGRSKTPPPGRQHQDAGDQEPYRPPVYHRDIDRLLFAQPESRLRMPYPEDYDFDYVHPGRTHPGVYDPYLKQFDGGFVNYYESDYLYDRGLTLEDLPSVMPSARDLGRRKRAADGLPLPMASLDGSAPKVHHPPGRIWEAAGEKEHSDAKTATTARNHWNNHFESDIHDWKGTAPGYDFYNPKTAPPSATKDHRYTSASIAGSACRDFHGGGARSLFSGKPVPFAGFHH